MSIVDIPAAPPQNGSRKPGARRSRTAHVLHRLTGAIALLASGPVAAQQHLPMRAVCVPTEPLLADVQSGAATMREVYVDGEGDRWLVFERAADGASVIGWINVERAVFCIVAGRPQRQTDGHSGRGA